MLLRSLRMDRTLSFLLIERGVGTSLLTASYHQPWHERSGGYLHLIRNCGSASNSCVHRLPRGTGDRRLSLLSSLPVPRTTSVCSLPSRRSRFRRSVPYNQQATFISLPGGGDKRKDYAERRLSGFSMDQMYDVVADVEKYQDFLPWCQSSVVKSRRKGHILADLVVGFPPLLESYTSSVTLTKPHLIRAESTEGKLFNQMITTWKFSPGLKGRPQTCVVDFYVSFEFRSSLTSQLGNVFFNEVVKAMAGAFFLEAKRRYGVESIPSRKINIVPVTNNKK